MRDFGRSFIGWYYILKEWHIYFKIQILIMITTIIIFHNFLNILKEIYRQSSHNKPFQQIIFKFQRCSHSIHSLCLYCRLVLHKYIFSQDQNMQISLLIYLFYHRCFQVVCQELLLFRNRSNLFFQCPSHQLL